MIEVLAQADGGCPCCARSLIDVARHRWPRIDWTTVLDTLRARAERQRNLYPGWMGESEEAADALESAIEGREI